jgi:hypothetical protein
VKDISKIIPRKNNVREYLSSLVVSIALRFKDAGIGNIDIEKNYILL